LIHPENHDIAVAVMKKVDSELKQATMAAMTEYGKKRKCVELEKVEREKAMQISEITTKVPTCGVLAQMDASLAIKVGNFVNVLPDLLAYKMLHGGKGFVTKNETKDGVSTFTVKYQETESGSRRRSESGILISRLTVSLLAILVVGPSGNQEIR
jgi:hypothetical protein